MSDQPAIWTGPDWANYAGIFQARAAGDACAKKKEFRGNI